MSDVISIELLTHKVRTRKVTRRIKNITTGKYENISVEYVLSDDVISITDVTESDTLIKQATNGIKYRRNE